MAFELLFQSVLAAPENQQAGMKAGLGDDCVPRHILHFRPNATPNLCRLVSRPASCFRMPPSNGGQAINGGGD